MKDICIQLIELFKEFIGNNWGLWVLTCISLIVCIIKDKERRHKVVYPTIILLIVFFNPIIYSIIGERFMNGVYWRMLWILPIPMILAYVGTQVYSMIKNKVMKLISLCIIAIIIGICGQCVYNNDTYAKPTNEYELSQWAVDVADAILKDDTYDRKKVIVPNELLCDFKQYTSKIALLYGRNAYGYISEMTPEWAYVHDQMSLTNPDYEALAETSIQCGCNYIVFNVYNHVGYEAIEEYGYKKYDSVYGYDIYRIEGDII